MESLTRLRPCDAGEAMAAWPHAEHLLWRKVHAGMDLAGEATMAKVHVAMALHWR